jgi:hypothetical protein
VSAAVVADDVHIDVRLDQKRSPDLLHGRPSDAIFFAIERLLQWVAFCGVLSSVAATTCSILASEIWRGASGFGSS